MLDRLTQLARDGSAPSRGQLLRALVDLYLTESERLSPAEAVLFDDLVRQLLGKVEPADRLAVTARIGEAERVPPGLRAAFADAAATPEPAAAPVVVDPLSEIIEPGLSAAPAPDLSIVGDLAAMDQIDEASAVLAKASGLSAERVATLLLDGDPAPFATLARAVGLDAGGFAALAGLRARRLELAPGTIEPLVARYDAIPALDAIRMLRFMTGG